jgi:hypothetical protein
VRKICQNSADAVVPITEGWEHALVESNALMTENCSRRSPLRTVVAGKQQRVGDETDLAGDRASLNCESNFLKHSGRDVDGSAMKCW